MKSRLGNPPLPFPKRSPAGQQPVAEDDANRVERWRAFVVVGGIVEQHLPQEREVTDQEAPLEAKGQRRDPSGHHRLGGEDAERILHQCRKVAGDATGEGSEHSGYTLSF